MIVMGIALGVVFGGIIAFNLIKSFMMNRFFATFEPPAVSVSSAIAKTVDWQPKIDAIGNFVAQNGVEVSSEASGNVAVISFESGQYIEKGEPILTLDDRVDQAMLKFNQAELVLKELNFKRQADLFKRGATSSSTVDEAKANLQQAQAKVEEIQARISNKHITAPFPGRLGIRKVSVGEFISPGNTSIVSLQSLDPLFLEFYLPEQQYKKIKLDQTITFAVEEFPEVQFEGTISAINSKVDLTTHNILVQATLSNCPVEALADPKKSSLVKTKKELRGSKLIVQCNSEANRHQKIRDYSFIPGMFSSIQIGQEVKPNTLIVPSTAISYSLYGNSVYVIEKDKEGKKDDKGKDILIVQRVFVSTGEQQGNYTVVKKGIKPGQLIVSTGDLKLQNGTRVVINNKIPLNDQLDPDIIGE